MQYRHQWQVFTYLTVDDGVLCVLQRRAIGVVILDGGHHRIVGGEIRHGGWGEELWADFRSLF